jgi:hypothetical protein
MKGRLMNYCGRKRCKSENLLNFIFEESLLRFLIGTYSLSVCDAIRVPVFHLARIALQTRGDSTPAGDHPDHRSGLAERQTLPFVHSLHLFTISLWPPLPNNPPDAVTLYTHEPCRPRGLPGSIRPNYRHQCHFSRCRYHVKNGCGQQPGSRPLCENRPGRGPGYGTSVDFSSKPSEIPPFSRPTWALLQCLGRNCLPPWPLFRRSITM